MATIKKREGKTGTSYLIRSSCGYGVDGRQVVANMTWKPTPGMTPKQIEKELNRQAVLFDEKCAAQGAGSGNIKFQEFAQQWLREYAEPNLRPRTIARLYQLQERTYAAIGHIRLDKLTARHIQKFIDNLGEDGVSTREDRARPKGDILPKGMTQKALAKAAGVSCSTVSTMCRGEGITLKTAEAVAKALGKDTKSLFAVQKGKGRLAPKSIQHYLSFISSVLDYAFRFGMIVDNPCKRVVLPTAPQEEREVYTLEEVQRFLESLETAPIKYRAFFVLAIYGGFRKGELLGLEWQDIDFQNHVVKVQRTSQYIKSKGVFTDTTKTEKSRRTLKLPAAVFAVLWDLKAEQAQEQLKLGDYWKGIGRLFTTLNGSPMHPATPYSWLRKFCGETGQRFPGIHQFRHLNASLLINSGAHVKTVSSSLGHSNVTTTLNIYSHTFEEAQVKAAEAVADLLASRMA